MRCPRRRVASVNSMRRGQPSRSRLERQRPAQGLIEIGLLARRERRRRRSHEQPQPASSGTRYFAGVWCKLQRVESGGLAAPAAADTSPPSARTRISRPRSLSKSTCVTPRRGQHRDQEADEDGLAGAGRPADEGVAGVLAAAAVRIGGVAGVQRKVIRRASARDEQRERIAPVIAGRPPAG